jgi:hypothetical protein
VNELIRVGARTSCSSDGVWNLWHPGSYVEDVTKFLLWCLLLLFCWPLAIVALVAYPLVWVLLLPFRIVGIAVDGVLALLRGLVLLPARVVNPRGW